MRGDVPLAQELEPRGRRHGSPGRGRIALGLLGLAAFVLASVIVSVPAGAVRSLSAVPPGAYSIRAFDDVRTPFYGTSPTHPDVLINRWQPLQRSDGPYHWSAPDHAGTPYRSGGGMWEVRTPYGAGFKMVVTPEMTVPSGGKLAMVVDMDHLVQGVGHTEDWSGMFMLPRAGNRNGFPRNYSDWNAIIEFHTEAHDVHHQIGIDTTNAPYRNTIYFRSYDPATGGIRKVLAPRKVQYDHWYSWRIHVTWSYGADGLYECWLDERKLASWKGATLPQGEHPYLAFGFYSASYLRNEVWHARLRGA